MKLSNLIACICEGAAEEPSEFCSIDLHYHNVKSKTFIKHYFKDIETLLYAIQEYRRISRIPKEEYGLTDLLR
jgi:hypothetical protein